MSKTLNMFEAAILLKMSPNLLRWFISYSPKFKEKRKLAHVDYKDDVFYFDKVEKIFQLIEDNVLAPPSSYQLRGHNLGLDSCVNLLLSIEYQDSEITFSGGIPAKSLTDALLEEPLNYKMIIKDPAGEMYCSRFRQYAAKPVKRCYPLDFAPKAGSLIPGDYHLTISIDNQIVWNTRFALTESHNIDWQHSSPKLIK